MVYVAVTALVDGDDHRSNTDWVNAMLYTHFRDLWENPPEGFKEKLAALLDAAEQRGRTQSTQDDRGGGGGWGNA